MISKEDVKYAYKLFLGREPENLEVVANYCQSNQTLEQLSLAFISSPEFLRRMGGMFENVQINHHRHPFNLPRIPVETEASQHELDQMFSRINSAWELLGCSEPYWSVITQPQNFMDQFDKTKDQFFLSGMGPCENFLASLRRNDINPNNHKLCLELGCGVGRVTIHLAKSFKEVIALDISNAHLEHAKIQAGKLNLDNVSFQHYSRIDLLAEMPQVDAIISTLTLQHNPPPVMTAILKVLLGLLKTDGVIFFQIPTYKNGYLFEVDRYLSSSKPADNLEMHFLPQKVIFDLLASENCQCLEVREDGSLGGDEQSLSFTFLAKKL